MLTSSHNFPSFSGVWCSAEPQHWHVRVNLPQTRLPAPAQAEARSWDAVTHSLPHKLVAASFEEIFQNFCDHENQEHRLHCCNHLFLYVWILDTLRWWHSDRISKPFVNSKHPRLFRNGLRPSHRVFHPVKRPGVGIWPWPIPCLTNVLRQVLNKYF